jgi:transposase InsO family protein
MTVELASLGGKVSRITVAKYMNQLGLRSKLSKKFKVTTNSKHNHLIMPMFKQRIFGYQTFKVWVSDITYIRVKKDSCI